MERLRRGRDRAWLETRPSGGWAEVKESGWGHSENWGKEEKQKNGGGGGSGRDAGSNGTVN